MPYFGLTHIWAEEMVKAEPLTTTVSRKGQVILPKAVRSALGWEAGTRLVVENERGGVLLRPVSAFPETDPDDVFGCLAQDGPAKALAEMASGIVAEAKRRHARR